MVNYGVSRACRPCKQRHKKACSRCANSKRQCTYEYETEGELIFRHSTSKNDGGRRTLISPEKSLKGLSLKQAEGLVGKLGFSKGANKQTHEDSLILADFIHNFCFIPQNSQISRGYLSALPTILNRVDDQSIVSRAALIAAFASVGKRQNRPELLERAEKLYVSILGSFRKAIATLRRSTCIATFLTSVLLGLYEIVTATVGCPGAHNSHLKGLGAILATVGPPFNLLGSIHFFSMANAPYMTVPIHFSKHSPEPEDLDMKDLSIVQDRPPGEALSVPFANPAVNSMADLIVKLNSVMTRSEELLSLTFGDISAVRQYFDDILELDSELDTWASSQRNEWQPQSVRSATNPISKVLEIWPGSIKSFYDIYVASVWNTYWKCHILVLNVLIQCAKKLQDLLAGTTKSSNESQEKWEQKANNLADAIFSSVPFHLTRLNEIELDDLPDNPEDEQKIRSNLNEVGRAVGGLLLMHPLYIVMHKPIVSEERHVYARKMLKWIGTEMGIGEATALSDETHKIPFPYAAKGHVLIWAGMLISLSDDKTNWSFIKEVMELNGIRDDRTEIKCEHQYVDQTSSSWRI